MDPRIAIQPDETIHHNGERQSYSERWMALAGASGIQVVPVDVFSPDIMATISGCDAFMWRFSPSAHPRLYAKRLLHAVEYGLGVPVFPSIRTSWYAEDKVGQSCLLAAAGIPTPKTEVFWTREQAERHCDVATYPFVLKLAAGYQSANVRLVRNRDEARYYVDQLFGPGVTGLGYRPASSLRMRLRRLRMASEIARGRHPNAPGAEAELEHGYLYAQEFIPHNDFDTRVTVIGKRAFAFRRFNRPGDFRASGAGREDYDSGNVDEGAVRLAWRTARRLAVQAVAVDVMRRGQQPIVVELGITFPDYGVRSCPGHWLLDGDPESGKLEWVEGSMEPADAIFEDFAAEVRRSIADRTLQRRRNGVAHSS